MVENAGIHSEMTGEKPIDRSQLTGESHFDQIRGADAFYVGIDEFLESPAIFVTENVCGFRRRRTLIPEGTRTAFRAEGEQFSERSDAGISIVQEVFGFVKENLSGAQRRKRAAAEKGVRGKGRQPFSLPVLERPRRAFSSAAQRPAFCASSRRASRGDARCEPGGRECRRRPWDRRSARANA